MEPMGSCLMVVYMDGSRRVADSATTQKEAGQAASRVRGLGFMV